MENPYQPLKDDFRNFLYYVWLYLKLPPPTKVQYDIAEYMAGKPQPDSAVQRLVVEAFRGVGKSWIASAFVVWVLWNEPQLKCLIVSASSGRADAFTTFTKMLINNIEFLHELRPNTNQRDSNIAFDVGPSMPAHQPSVKSIGITGQLAGNRADLLIADDIESLKNSLTQLMRDRLIQASAEFDAIIMPKEGSKIIYLGTPQSEMSVYNSLPDRGYHMRIWPSEMPEDLEVYQGRIAPIIAESGLPVGEPTDPDRFNRQDLWQRRASYGNSGYALQYLLNPNLSDADRRPLKLADLIIMDCDRKMAPTKITWGRGSSNLLQDVPNIGLQNDRLYGPMFLGQDYAEYTGCVMSIDPSGSGSDETAYAIIKMLHGMLFLVSAGGIPGGYDDEVLTTIANLAKEYQVNYMVIEANLGLGMFGKLLQPHLVRAGHPVTIEDVRHNINKERRIIQTIEPVMNQHRLVVDKQLVIDDYRRDVSPDYKLFYQLTRLTMDKGCLAHDDAIDAVAMAVAYWVDYMARDTSQAASEYRDQLLEVELERFAEHVLGYSHNSNSSLATLDREYM